MKCLPRDWEVKIYLKIVYLKSEKNDSFETTILILRAFIFTVAYWHYLHVNLTFAVSEWRILTWNLASLTY